MRVEFYEHHVRTHLFMNETLMEREGEGAHSLKSGTLNMQSAWTVSSWRWPKGRPVVLAVLRDGAPDLTFSLVDIFPR